MVVTVVVVVAGPAAETEDKTFAAEGDADLVYTSEGLPTFKARFRLASLVIKETWTKHPP
jgi:hypothetical protein